MAGLVEFDTLIEEGGIHEEMNRLSDADPSQHGGHADELEGVSTDLGLYEVLWIQESFYTWLEGLNNTSSAYSDRIFLNSTDSAQQQQQAGYYHYPPYMWDAESLTKYFTIPGAILLSCFGIVSNIIAIVVFYRLRSNDSCGIIFTGIAISDLIYCLIAFISYAIKAASMFGPNENPFQLSTVFEVFVKYGIDILIQFNCWATAYLALERMVSVVFPFHVKSYFTSRRTCGALVAIFVLCFALQCHNILRFRAFWVEYIHGERILTFDSNGLISEKAHGILTIINGGVIRLIAIVLIAVFNAILVVKIRKANEFQRSLAPTNRRQPGNPSTRSPKEKTEAKLTRIMLTVSMMVFICYSPNVGYVVCRSLKACTNVFLHNVSPFLPVLELTNSCLNACIYFALSSKFNQELKQMCSCCERGQPRTKQSPF